MAFDFPKIQQILNDLSTRLQQTATVTDIHDALTAFAATLNTGTTTVPVVPPAPTNLTNTVVGTSVTLQWTPPPTDVTQIITRGGVIITTVAATTSSFTDPTALNTGSYVYTVAGVNAVGTGSAISTTAVVVAPTAPPAPTNLANAPNSGSVTLSWTASPGATSYQVIRGGTLISTVTTTTFAESAATSTPFPLAAGTYVYQVKGVNSAGAGSASSTTCIVPSVVSSIVYTSRGTTTTSGNSASTTVVSGSFTPTAGNVILAAIDYYSILPNPGGSVTDSIGDTGGTAWGKVVDGTESISGDFYYATIWSRQIGTSPSAGTVTFTRTPPDNSFWYSTLSVGELTNAASATALHFNSNTSVGASVVVDLGAAPAAGSFVVTDAIDGAASGLPTMPAGYTSINSSQPGSASFGAAYKNGSAAQTQTWTSLDSHGNVAVSAEFGQTSGGGGGGGGGGGTVVPPTPTGLTSSQTAQSGNVKQVTLNFNAISTAQGIDVWFGGTDVTHQIAFPLGNNITSYTDPTFRAPGVYDYYVAGYNGAGVGTQAHIVVTVASAGTSLQPYLGYSAESLSPGSGWQDGTNVQYDISQLSTPNAKWITTWSDLSLGNAQFQITAFHTLSQPGQKLAGFKPVHTIPIGFNVAGTAAGSSLTAVNAGSHDSNIDSYASTLQAAVVAGDYPNAPPILRMGHEFTISGFPWGITNNTASINAYNAAYTRQRNRIHAICPTAQFEVCAIPGAQFDWSAAIPWSLVNYVGMDIYDDWQGPGSAKTSSTNAYATYVDPVAAWSGKWYDNSSPTSPSVGCAAWLWNLGIANGKPWCMSEWGLMARLALPGAGGGDNIYFIQQIAALMATGNVHHADYFTADATFNGQLQDHILWRRDSNGNLLFPLSYAKFVQLFSV